MEWLSRYITYDFTGKKTDELIDESVPKPNFNSHLLLFYLILYLKLFLNVLSNNRKKPVLLLMIQNLLEDINLGGESEKMSENQKQMIAKSRDMIE